MQNIDLYSGNTIHKAPSSFTAHESDFFNRMRPNASADHDKQVKRASRIIFAIAALCIMSFTTGLVLGIKFAGGENAQIIDDTTYEAVGQIGERVSGFVSGAGSGQSTKFSAAEYPYMLRIGEEHQLKAAKDVAAYLHSLGHTVILLPKTADKKVFRIYAGYYKNLTDAEKDLVKLDSYKKYSVAGNVRIIKRS